MGKKSSVCGIEMITLENGAICRSVHGGLNSHSIWFSVYGQKGSMESTREVENNGGVEGFHIRAHKTDGEYSKEGFTAADYMPKHELSEQAAVFGHGGSDYYSMYFCMEKLLGRDHGETIDVFEALDMFLPGMFAYRSILGGGIPMDIPNLRDKQERESGVTIPPAPIRRLPAKLIPCYQRAIRPCRRRSMRTSSALGKPTRTAALIGKNNAGLPAFDYYLRAVRRYVCVPADVHPFGRLALAVNAGFRLAYRAYALSACLCVIWDELHVSFHRRHACDIVCGCRNRHDVIQCQSVQA